MGVDCDESIAYCWSSSGDDVDRLCLIISSTLAVCDWCISILAMVVNGWRISILIVLTKSCSLMNRHHHLMKTSSKWSKCRDPHPCDSIVRQTINKLSFQTTMNNIFRNTYCLFTFFRKMTKKHQRHTLYSVMWKIHT